MAKCRLRAANLDQTPSLPDARPRSDRFRCGGRESKFLAVKFFARPNRMAFSRSSASTRRPGASSPASKVVAQRNGIILRTMSSTNPRAACLLVPPSVHISHLVREKQCVCVKFPCCQRLSLDDLALVFNRDFVSVFTVRFFHRPHL